MPESSLEHEISEIELFVSRTKKAKQNTLINSRCRVRFCRTRTDLRPRRMAVRFRPLRAGHVQMRRRERLRRLQRRDGLHERDVLVHPVPVRQRPVRAVHVEMRLGERLRRRFGRGRFLRGEDVRVFPGE